MQRDIPLTIVYNAIATSLECEYIIDLHCGKEFIQMKHLQDMRVAHLVSMWLIGFPERTMEELEESYQDVTVFINCLRKWNKVRTLNGQMDHYIIVGCEDDLQRLANERKSAETKPHDDVEANCPDKWIAMSRCLRYDHEETEEFSNSYNEM